MNLILTINRFTVDAMKVNFDLKQGHEGPDRERLYVSYSLFNFSPR